jgi:uncharacterized protein YkwD
MAPALSPRLLAAALLALCALLLLPAASHATPSRAAACAGAQLVPDAGNVAAVRAAVLCLHNRERAARRLPALRENARLRSAAKAHALDMVDDRYFSHDAPDGTDMVKRILATGYAGGKRWSVGENLAWGSAHLASAASIHDSWMRSPGHRANILQRQFREIGIGIALGAPVDSRVNGTTYAADFGVRR